MYYSNLIKTLNLPVSEAEGIFEQAGVLLTDEIASDIRPLADEELRRLRPIVLRYYRLIAKPVVPRVPNPPQSGMLPENLHPAESPPDVVTNPTAKDCPEENPLEADPAQAKVPESRSPEADPVEAELPEVKVTEVKSQEAKSTDGAFQDTVIPEDKEQDTLETAAKEEEVLRREESQRNAVSLLTPAENEMDRIAMWHVIMIDTCSWMHSACGRMVDRLLPSLKKYGKKVILPESVRRELIKHSENPVSQERAVSARKGLEQCQRLQSAGCLSLKGSEKDHFADNSFFVQFSNYRMRHRMLLITQDNALTDDILSLNSIGSRNGYPVRVMRITQDGGLADSRPEL